MRYKVEGNVVFWHNKEKWLVKETCASAEEAQELLVVLESQTNG